MSESDSFIREVTEEVRQDRLFKWWKRYAPFVIGGIALIVATSAAWNWYRYQERQAAQERGAAFLAVDPLSTEDAEKLLASTDGTAAAIAELRLAATLAQTGEGAAAAERYRAVAGRQGLKRAYTDLALLQALRIEAETRPASDVIADLGALTGEDGPYRLLALELRAVLKINSGDTKGAAGDIDAALSSDGLTGALAARLRGLRETLDEPAVRLVE